MQLTLLHQSNSIMYTSCFSKKPMCLFFAVAVLALTALPGCRKDQYNPANPTVTPQANPPAYNFPLTIGSYWIYEHVLLDPAMNVISTGAIDSVFICADTLIHGDTFYVFGRQTSGSPTYFVPGFIYDSYYLRDSAGYLVHPSGYFVEHDNFQDTLHIYSIPAMAAYSFMRHPDSLITVPAGTFPTIDYRTDYYFANPQYMNRQGHKFYADDIGIVSWITFYAQSGNFFQRRLLRYHIQ